MDAHEAKRAKVDDAPVPQWPNLQSLPPGFAIIAHPPVPPVVPEGPPQGKPKGKYKGGGKGKGKGKDQAPPVLGMQSLGDRMGALSDVQRLQIDAIKDLASSNKELAKAISANTRELITARLGNAKAKGSTGGFLFPGKGGAKNPKVSVPLARAPPFLAPVVITRFQTSFN